MGCWCKLTARPCRYAPKVLFSRHARHRAHSLVSFALGHLGFVTRAAVAHVSYYTSVHRTVHIIGVFAGMRPCGAGIAFVLYCVVGVRCGCLSSVVLVFCTFSRRFPEPIRHCLLADLLILSHHELVVFPVACRLSEHGHRARFVQLRERADFKRKPCCVRATHPERTDGK